jgi:hypothetical protein
MDTPENKAAPVESKTEKTQKKKAVIALHSPDGKKYLTSDPAEATHLHRAHGYRFDDDKQRESVLSTH